MSAERAEALEVLREVWRSRGQTAAGLGDGGGSGDDGGSGEGGHGKSCRRMTDAGVGFDGFAAGEDGLTGGEDAGHAGGGGAGLTAAWRARLAREGKLRDSGASVRDLVLGPGDDG